MDYDEAKEIAEDAILYFYHGFKEEVLINNLYKRRWTNDRSVDEEVWLTCSEFLYEHTEDYDEDDPEHTEDIIIDLLEQLTEIEL